MRRYNKISMLTIFTVILCISVLGTVSATDTANSNTGPTVTANLTSGTYNVTQTVALTMNDSSATTYYTKDSTDPRNSSTRITYTTPLTINTTTTLRYAAEDPAGNWSPLYIQNYIIGNGTIANSTNNYNQLNYTGSQTNTTYWTYTVGSSNTDSVVTVSSNGTIYVGTWNGNSHDGALYAFSPNGTLLWKYTTYGGIKGAPTIGSDETIYVGSYWGVVYAINPDGTIKWKYNATESVIHYITNPIVIGPDGTIYVSISNLVPGFYAFNPDGTVKWTKKASGSITIDSNGIIHCGGSAFNQDGTSSPETSTSETVGSDGTIYTISGVTITATNPNGTTKWTYTVDNSTQWSGISCFNIASDGTIYFGVYNQPWALYALNSNGTLKWSYDNFYGSIYSCLIGSDETIYISILNGPEVYGVDTPQYSDLYALKPNGTVKWTYHTGGSLSLTITSDGTIYTGGRATGVFYVIKDVPIASFTSNVTTGDSPLSVQFNDTSSNPTSWSWDFGDGTSSNSQTPTHIYTKTGTYKVTLTVTNCYGNDTKISYVTVTDNTPPTVNVSLQGGSYYSPKSVTLKGSETGTIYYTLTGVNPTTNSTKYNGTINLTTSKTLKFFAVDATGNISQIYTQRYNIYKLVSYKYKVSAKWKKVWAKVKWKKVRGKWRYHWVKVWKYKTITKTGTKWIIT